MNKKGFTLIELLAVIVILAIIALIATPLILGVIETARNGATKSSALGYIDAVEKQSAIGMISNNDLLDGTYDVKELEVSYKGEKIESGTINASNGTVEKALLKINDYYACYSDNNVEVDKDQTKLTQCSDMTIVELVGDPILEKAKSLVYDENGVCKTDGTTYTYIGGCYIKGETYNNYLWYNGFMWRVMGINSDKTVRLITDEAVTIMSYGPNYSAFKYIENEGYIHDWLNDYFYKNLNSTKSIIKEGPYFCSEQTTSEVRETCSESSIIRTKVGLISMDEVKLAGNATSYLNIRQGFWTMTPYDNDNIWEMMTNGGSTGWGGISSNSVVYGYSGVRPVINVDSKAIITAGDGSALNFYVLGQDKASTITGTIGEKATGGEYVKLEGKTYRVVRKTTDGVKLILDSYIGSGTFGNSDTFTLDSGIGAKLNGDVLSSLGLTDSDKIVETIYYQGDGYESGMPYTDLLTESNGVKAKVGLIQTGEVLASQSSTIRTNNYTSLYNYSVITQDYWIISKASSDSYALTVGVYGNCLHEKLYETNYIRPVITVKSDLKINGGNGIWSSPYEI